MEHVYGVAHDKKKQTPRGKGLVIREDDKVNPPDMGCNPPALNSQGASRSPPGPWPGSSTYIQRYTRSMISSGSISHGLSPSEPCSMPVIDPCGTLQSVHEDRTRDVPKRTDVECDPLAGAVISVLKSMSKNILPVYSAGWRSRPPVRSGKFKPPVQCFLC